MMIFLTPRHSVISKVIRLNVKSNKKNSNFYDRKLKFLPKGFQTNGI